MVPESGKASEKPQEAAILLYAVWFKRPRGAEEYSEYLWEASPIAEKYGARRVGSLIGQEALNGSFNPDYIYLVAWPSIDAYYEFLKDPQYRAVAQLLPSAVEKTNVIHCRNATQRS